LGVVEFSRKMVVDDGLVTGLLSIPADHANRNTHHHTPPSILVIQSLNHLTRILLLND
jgi:hypothetical protein